MNFNKYSPLAKMTEEPDATLPASELKPLNSWRDSSPITELSGLLKRFNDQGIRLCRRDGTPVLCFDPGLRSKDRQTERWIICNEAVKLMLAATEDIRELLAHGLLDLPAADSVILAGAPPLANHREPIVIEDVKLQAAFTLSVPAAQPNPCAKEAA